MTAVDRIVGLGAPRFTIEDVDDVAGNARVELLPEAAQRLSHSFGFVEQLVTRQIPVYGLTTGCGPLSGNAITAETRQAFQRNLIRSHAVTLGAPHPTEFVRAGMVVRARVFAQGFSAVDPACVDLILAMLNHRFHPIVRSIGGVGASGDLVELAQIALALIGEGTVEVEGRETPAHEAFASVGISPLSPRFREGLALINGTSFHTGAAALLVARAQRLSRSALLGAAMTFDALGGHVEALDSALHVARGMDGQIDVAKRCLQLLSGSRLVRRTEPVAHAQDAYTLRCLPQVHGAIDDVLAQARTTIETELNAISDNPLFLADEDRVVHGGNFHGQPVAMAIDQLKLGLVELGAIVERRLARLLDASLNGGLPAFLVRDATSHRSGFMGLQYCATTMAAENGILATPASTRSIPTNANNQDIVSMAMIGARHAWQVLENVERMVAIELICAAQALDLRGIDAAGVGTRATHALIRRLSAPLDDDRSLQLDVERVVGLLRHDGLRSVG